MLDDPSIGDTNAPVSWWCYKRMGEFVPAAARRGTRAAGHARVPGIAAWPRHMGAHDVLDARAGITTRAEPAGGGVGLGCPWYGPVASFTPVQDDRLHVPAWQYHRGPLRPGLVLSGSAASPGGDGPAERSPTSPTSREDADRLRLPATRRGTRSRNPTERDQAAAPAAPPGLRQLPGRGGQHQSGGQDPGAVTPSGRRCSLTTRPRACPALGLGGKGVPPLVTEIADGETAGR